MLVMALEDYDEVTGKAAKAPILLRDVVGKSPPVTHVRPPKKGCWYRWTARRHRPGLYQPALRQAGGDDHRRAGRFDLPRSRKQDLADR